MKKVVSLLLFGWLCLCLSACQKENNTLMDVPDNLDKTNKIIVANSSSNPYTTITDEHVIEQILDLIVYTGKKSNEPIMTTLVPPEYYLEMYDENEELIDILGINVFDFHESIASQNTNNEYDINYSDEKNLKLILEKMLNRKYLAFYSTDKCDEKRLLAYEDDENNYYIDSTYQMVWIMAINKKMTFQEALDGKYITIEDLKKDYSYILKSEAKI